MANYLVTGGGGFIGAEVTKGLVDKGHKVVVLDPYPNVARLEVHGILDKIVLRKKDISRFENIAIAIKDHNIERIIHLAHIMGRESNEDPLLAAHVNLIGSINVFEAARIFDVQRVVFASSITVYGPSALYPPEVRARGVKEEDVIYTATLKTGVPAYTASKINMELMGEFYRRTHKMELCGLRPSIVVGLPRMTGITALVSNIIEMPATGKPTEIANGNTLVNIVHVYDVANQFIFMSEVDWEKLENLGHYVLNTGGVSCHMHEIADTVKKFIPDAKIKVTMGPEEEIAGVMGCKINNEKISKLGCPLKYDTLEKIVLEQINDARKRAGLTPIK